MQTRTQRGEADVGRGGGDSDQIVARSQVARLLGDQTAQAPAYAVANDGGANRTSDGVGHPGRLRNHAG